MEEKDINIIEEYIKKQKVNSNSLGVIQISHLDNAVIELLQAYKQDEKVIEEMAKYLSIKNYTDDICEFRLDVKGRFHKHCYKGKCKNCIIDYFRKKCEEYDSI